MILKWDKAGVWNYSKNIAQSIFTFQEVQCKTSETNATVQVCDSQDLN